ncbi:MAG: FG-GAP-like repeat-containing protein [Myxococcaceae bacterium]|nr:FG-GAP-like repeat-containing protein [Myxococcaceae bacterium]
MRLALLAILVSLSACQCGNQVTVRDRVPDAGGPDAGADAGSDGGADAGHPFDAGSFACSDGDPCGDGGVCAGGSCCAADLACGPSCCGSGTVCSFLRCVTPGAACRDSSECPATDFCDLASSRPGTSDAGVCTSAPTPGQCVTQPPACPPDAGPADIGRRCIEPCRFTRSAQSFRPVVKYAWGSATLPTDTDVMMAPIVTQLTDDDCDGRITAQDTPEIVVVTFANGAYTQIGIVRALTVRSGVLTQVWQRPGVINAASQLASGNIDGQPGNEVVGCGPNGPVALRGDGAVLWSAVPPVRGCGSVSLADLDGDGSVEVVTESQALDGRTGAVKSDFTFFANSTVADVDGDGRQDVVTASTVAFLDGGTLASVSGPAGYVAVGDLNRDGRPEIVSVNSSTHTLAVWSYDPASPTRGTLVRSGIDINGALSPSLCPAGSAGNVGGGGPPTVGDFNGDGFPDVALAGGIGYAVFDGQKLMDGVTPAAQTLLWIRQTQDCSSAATGSTLFDFDGDGRVEVVYADELNLHVYDAANGTELVTTCNTSGTLIEYPLVADVDNDGQADLIVVSNAYAFACQQDPTVRFSGVRVFRSMDDNWVVTRKVWNQHAYSVTNIEEDGTVPRAPQRNWTVPGLNNFRQNKQPGLEFAAADAIVTVTGSCVNGGVDYRITVRNIGEAPLPPGVRVELVATPATAPQTLVGFVTTRSLGPTQAETFAFSAPQSIGSLPVVARVNPGAVRECRTGNNESSPPTVGCIN